jgi:predicted RNase H-like HicB family nuclease
MNLHFFVSQDEDGWLIAECPALPGCVTQARTQLELAVNMKEAALSWMLAEDAKAVERMTHDRADELKNATLTAVAIA